MYIGEKEVSSVNGHTVSFVDGTQKELTDKQLLYLITEEPKTPTEYKELVMSNVLPELLALINNKGREELSDLELGTAIFNIMEEHNVTNKQVSALITRLTNSLITSHNERIEKKVGKATQEFNVKLEKLTSAGTVMTDSYNKALFTACGYLFGTYEAGQEENSCLENITFAHLTKVLTENKPI